MRAGCWFAGCPWCAMHFDLAPDAAFLNHRSMGSVAQLNRGLSAMPACRTAPNSRLVGDRHDCYTAPRYQGKKTRSSVMRLNMP